MTMNTIALVAEVCWLAVLSTVVVLCVHQLTLVTKRLELLGGPTPIDESGPAVGMPVPAEVEGLTMNGDGAAGQLILLMSATCEPCRGLAEQFGREEVREPVVVLLPGREELADEVVALLPQTLRVVRDPEASEYASALSIVHTPFALAIREGIVVGKSPVNRLEDLQRLGRAMVEADLSTRRFYMEESDDGASSRTAV
jgi:hypothetical protein